MNDKKNYCFIPFNKSKHYQSNNYNLSGSITLKITTIDSLYIGSGFTYTSKNNIILESVKNHEDIPIIPGSSLKGAVRTIAQVVSDCCNDNNIKFCNNDYHCIVCDTFGRLGFKSKVQFSDFICSNPLLEKKTVNKQFPPKKTQKDSYKLYYNDCKDVLIMEDTILIETIKPNNIFIGKIIFKNLSTDELELLLYSLGIVGIKAPYNFNIKLGGFKSQGLGQVSIKCIELKLNGDNINNPEDYANGYIEHYGNAFEENIYDIGCILEPYIKRS